MSAEKRTTRQSPSDSAGYLPVFLRYLNTYPSAEDILQALASGPLFNMGMTAGSLWVLVDGASLASIGHAGWPPDLIDRYSVIPLSLDVPPAHAVRDDKIRIDQAAGFGRRFVDALDEGYLDDELAALATESVINVPLRHSHSVVGCLGFVTREVWPDTEDAGALLTSLSYALGLWLTHPRSRIVESSLTSQQREWSLAFSPRQKQVLTLVGAGHSNSQIARQLHVSVSSVKQDMQHAMRALRTHSRDSAYERAKRLTLLD